MRVEELDGAVVAVTADLACVPKRAERLARKHDWPPTAAIVSAWRNFILKDHDIGQTYGLQLIDHVEVPHIRSWLRTRSRRSWRNSVGEDAILMPQ